MKEHPSGMALDLHAIGAGDASVAQHVASCAECAAVVHERTAFDEMRAPARVLQSAPPRRKPLWWLLAPAVACAAMVLFAINDDDSGVREKAAPAVGVHVLRAGALTLWNGRDALQPGDTLQIEVTGSGYEYIAIASQEPDHLVWLYNGNVKKDEHGRVMVPISMVVDSKGDHETIGVVMSRKARDAGTLAGDLQKSRRERDVWATTLSFKKSVGP